MIGFWGILLVLVGSVILVWAGVRRDAREAPVRMTASYSIQDVLRQAVSDGVLSEDQYSELVRWLAETDRL